LLRAHAVERIEIPAVARQEDYFILKYCKHYGWKVKYASDVIVFTSFFWFAKPLNAILRRI
jgi:hypothetical protein